MKYLAVEVFFSNLYGFQGSIVYEDQIPVAKRVGDGIWIDQSQYINFRVSPEKEQKYEKMFADFLKEEPIPTNTQLKKRFCSAGFNAEDCEKVRKFWESFKK